MSVTPGATALTRTAGAHSTAATLTTMSRAAFEAQYRPMVRSTSRELTLPTATTDPPPDTCMAPARARMASHTPLALTPITRSHSAGSASASSPLCPMPAVTVTSAGAPIRSRVARAAASTWPGSVMSHRTSLPGERSHTTTSTPALR